MRFGAWFVLGVAGCAGGGDGPVDTDDTDVVDTDVDPVDTATDTQVDTDTDVVSACGEGEPVTVVATEVKGWLVEDAAVRWFLLDGRSGVCDRVPPPDAYDAWTCDAPLDGDLWVTVTHPFLRGYTEVVTAGVDGCRDGGERLDGANALTPAGTPFDESRVYAWRRYEDDYTCEHSFELYGQGCWSNAYFCSDGHSVVLDTDILNEGVYRLEPDGTVLNHLFPLGDVPQDTMWTPVDPDTLRAWDNRLWVLMEDEPAWPCSDFVWQDTGGPPPIDTGDSGVDTDTDTDTDTDGPNP